jgi:chemotaxis protein CheY-P-specific phosphatase CheC
MGSEELAEQDLLRLIEQGVASSADKLADISHTDWATQTVSIKTAPLKRFYDAMTNDDKEQSGSFFTIPGGVFLVMFPTSCGKPLADVFLPASTSQNPDIKNREDESLAEISNIVVNKVAGTIADACDTSFFLSAPKMIRGTKKSLLKAAPDMITTPGDKFTVMAYVHMSSAALSADCTVILLLSPAWRQRLLSALE